MLSKRPIPKQQLWRAGTFCVVREECLPVVFLNELCPHDLTSQRRFLTLTPCKKPHKPNKKNPKQQNHDHKKPYRPGNRLKPPKNSSLSFKKYLRQLPQQADRGYKGHGPWHAGPSVPPHPVKSGLQNRAHPTGTALRTQEGLQTPRPPVWYFHQDHENSYYNKKGSGS